MITNNTLIKSKTKLQIVGKDIDPWQSSSYQSDGIYFSLQSNWYFLVKAGSVQGVSKEIFEANFIDDVEQDKSEGVDEDLFLKTVALLSNRASEFKYLKD